MSEIDPMTLETYDRLCCGNGDGRIRQALREREKFLAAIEEAIGDLAKRRRGSSEEAWSTLLYAVSGPEEPAKEKEVVAGDIWCEHGHRKSGCPECLTAELERLRGLVRELRQTDWIVGEVRGIARIATKADWDAETERLLRGGG